MNFIQKNNIFKYTIFFFWFGYNLSFSQHDNFPSNNFKLDPLFPSLFLDSLSYENNEIILNRYFGNIFLGERQYFTKDQYENYLFNKQFQDYWKNRISRNANLDLGGEIPKVGLGEGGLK